MKKPAESETQPLASWNQNWSDSIRQVRKSVIPDLIRLINCPPIRDPIQWAVQCRVMSETSPEPGKVRNDRSPYLNQPAKAFIDPHAQRITFITGSQCGKSFLQENVVGRQLADDACPIIVYAPTLDNIVQKVEPIISAMIRQSTELAPIFDKRNSTQFVKKVGAGIVHLSHVGSTAQTSSTSARLVLVDELDRCASNSEGSIIELVEARGDSYADSKLGITATPTLGRLQRFTHPVTGFTHWDVGKKTAVSSATWREWQDGTRHEWAIPCPDCHEFFIPWSGLLHWPGKNDDTEVDPTRVEREAGLTCPNCGVLIEDKHRQHMNKRGVYISPGESVDQNGRVTGESETAGNSHKSFWCSGLCSWSAKKSYGFLAKKVVNAQLKGDPEVLQPVYNTGFGECFALTFEVPLWESVQAMVWRYHSNELIADPQMILCTVDVHKNRLNYVIRAWFLGMGSALIEAGELWGDTLQPEIWDELGDFYNRSWNGYEINEIGIDCGYRDEIVFDFVSRNKGRARALRGYALNKPFRAVKLEVDKRGRSAKHGAMRWDFNSPAAKTWVHSRIGWDKNKPAFWVLPADVSEKYCKQIVGEEYDDKKNKWNQIGENHFLDCEAMNYMLARMRGLKGKRGQDLLNDITQPDTNRTADRNTHSRQPDEPVKPVNRQRSSRSTRQGDSWLGNVGGGGSWL
jgi:phage terminase large subunit GpA-like protein